MKTIKQLLIILSIAVMVSAATAQTNIIFLTDFDNDTNEGNFYNDYGYTAAGSSSLDPDYVVSYTEGIVAGVGVGGTYANSATADYSLLGNDSNWTNPANSYVYAVLGNGTQFGYPMTAITPTAYMNSLILSADLQVTGLPPGLTNADVQINKVQFISEGTVLFDFIGDAGYVGSNFVHITMPLSALSYGSAPGDPVPAQVLSDFTNAAIVSSIDSFTVEFAVNELVGTIGGNPPIEPVFGFTTNGTLIVDNIQLIQTPPIPPQPLVEKLIWQADFDTTFPNAGGFVSSYRNGANTAITILSTNVGGGVGGSNSLECTLNDSSWSSSPPNSYSGFIVGATGNPLPFALSTTNKNWYRVYFSAKVGGLIAGLTNCTGCIDLMFSAPSNGTEILVLDLNPLNISFTTNWQSYVFDSMPIGVNQSPYPGSQASFNQYFSQVNQISLQVVPQGNPNNLGTSFGYDSNNTVDMDNIKVVELVPGLAPISMVRTNSQTKIFWADPPTGGFAQLQSSTNAAGPYVNVAGAASGAQSPYTVPAGNKQQFFRTVWVP